jgi:hypothetical protein
MTNPEIRALCAELVGIWDAKSDLGFSDFWHSTAELVDRARAALAQPEPVAPTESDVTELFYRHMGEGSEVGFENAVAEALARWGTPANQPEPVAPTDLDAEFRSWYVDRYGRPYFGGIALVECAAWTRFALARWGTPTNTINQEDYE